MIKEFNMKDFNNMITLISVIRNYIDGYYSAIENAWTLYIDDSLDNYSQDDVDLEINDAYEDIRESIYNISGHINNKNSRMMVDNMAILYNDVCNASTHASIIEYYYRSVAKINTKGGVS
jgi:hypothetical protein